MRAVWETVSERCQRGAHVKTVFIERRSTELLFLPLFRPWMVKYTYFYVKMPVFASILVNTVMQVLSESKQLRKKTHV